MIRKLLVIVALILWVFVSFEMITTYKAHDTFDGYCKWRWLAVESKANNYGYCKNTKTGKEYKIVLFGGRWYLDWDLPCGFLCF